MSAFCSFPSIHKQNLQSQYLQGFRGFSTVIRVLFTKKEFYCTDRNFQSHAHPAGGIQAGTAEQRPRGPDLEQDEERTDLDDVCEVHMGIPVGTEQC